MRTGLPRPSSDDADTRHRIALLDLAAGGAQTSSSGDDLFAWIAAMAAQTGAGPGDGAYRLILRHSLATAFIAGVLVDGHPGKLAGVRYDDSIAYNGFTAGLSHDLGKLVLLESFPRDAAAFYSGYLRRHVRFDDLPALERLTLGCDHIEAGNYAAAALGMSCAVAEVIRFHHFPDHAAPEQACLIRRVALADTLAKLLGHAGNPASMPSDYVDSAAWKPFLARDVEEGISALDIVMGVVGLRGELTAFIESFMRPPAAIR
jgi:hypothetical protein